MFGRRSVTASVTGLTCKNCVRHVTDAVVGLPGVKRASVDLVSGGTSTVTVTATKEFDEDAFRAAVADAGYEVTAIN